MCGGVCGFVGNLMLGPRFSIFSKTASNVKKNSYQMQRIIERRQRRDMRNELDQRTASHMQRGNIMTSVRYDPTMRSSTSLMSHGEQVSPTMMMQEAEMRPSFGGNQEYRIRAETIKTNKEKERTPNFYKQTDGYMIPPTVFFHAAKGAILSSSDSEDIKDHRSAGSDRKPLKQKEGKKDRGKVRSESSAGYNVSSEEEAEVKKNRPRRRSSSAGGIRGNKSLNGAPAPENHSVSFGDSDGSDSKKSESGALSDHDQLLNEGDKSDNAMLNKTPNTKASKNLKSKVRATHQSMA